MSVASSPPPPDTGGVISTSTNNTAAAATARRSQPPTASDLDLIHDVDSPHLHGGVAGGGNNSDLDQAIEFTKVTTDPRQTNTGHDKF